MTLLEKLCEPFDGLPTETVNKLEKIADDFAIGFAEWIEKYVCEHCNGDGYTIEIEAECCRGGNDYCCGIPIPIQTQKECYCNSISTNELFEIYKREKEL